MMGAGLTVCFQNPFNDTGGRSPGDQFNNLYIPAISSHNIRANDVPGAVYRIGIVISAFHKDTRQYLLYQFQRGILREDGYKGNATECGDDSGPVLLMNQWPERPFQPADGGIAVDAHHKRIAQRCRRLQIFHMTAMKNIKTPVRKHHTAPFAAQPRAMFDEILAR